MKAIIFNEDIQEEEIVQLIETVDATEETNLYIYFSTPGGTTYYAELLVDYLNRLHESEEKHITVIILYSCSSAGLSLLEDSKFPVIIGPNAIGIVHNESLLATLQRELSLMEKSVAKKVNERNLKALETLSKILPEKDIRSIKSGKDVCLDSKQLNAYYEACQESK